MTGCEHIGEAAAFVLKALRDDEAAAFAAHAATCGVCGPEVERLQVVADTLPLAAPVVAPPPHLKGRIMAVVESEAALLRAAAPRADEVPRKRRARSRRRRWSGAALTLRPAVASVAAALLLAVGVAGGLLVGAGSDAPSTRVIRADVGGIPDRTGAAALLSVTGDEGRLHTTNFPAPPPGRIYQVWILRANGGAPEPTDALFTVDRRGSSSVAVPGDLRGVEKILVTPEPTGGSRSPTAPPVLSVSLA